MAPLAVKASGVIAKVLVCRRGRKASIVSGDVGVGPGDSFQPVQSSSVAAAGVITLLESVPSLPHGGACAPVLSGRTGRSSAV